MKYKSLVVVLLVLTFSSQVFADSNVQFINKTGSDIEVLYEDGIVNVPKRIVVRYKDVEIVTGSTRFKVKVFHRGTRKFLGQASLNNVYHSITFSEGGGRFEIRAD